MRILYNSVWSDVDACDLKADRLHSNIYLLTRFNLKFWRIAKSGMDTRSQEWLQKRFELFEQYCLPSIASQTYENFSWFCLFSEDTPEKYLQRLVELKKLCPQFYPVLLSDTETADHCGAIGSLIDKVRQPEKTLVTLRIDNDDAIALNFIEKAITFVEDQVEPRKIYWFNRGLQYYHKEHVAFSYRFDPNHYPFMINKHPQDGDLNILAFSHRETHREGFAFKYVDSPEMWMEVVHGDNVMNEVHLSLHQRPFTSLDASYKNFIPVKLLTRKMHYVTFLIPRMIKHLIRRIGQKL